MDEQLRALERRWRETGDEADQHRWLCQRLRTGWADELRHELAELERFGGGFDDDAVEAECRTGFVTAGDPRARLAAFSEHEGWYPTADPRAALRTVCDPRRTAQLYPHRAYDADEAPWQLLTIFAEGAFFTNYSDWSDEAGRSRGRAIAPLRSAKPEWETSVSLAVGAVLGPLVAYVSVNARDSL